MHKEHLAFLNEKVTRTEFLGLLWVIIGFLILTGVSEVALALGKLFATESEEEVEIVHQLQEMLESIFQGPDSQANRVILLIRNSQSHPAHINTYTVTQEQGGFKLVADYQSLHLSQLLFDDHFKTLIYKDLEALTQDLYVFGLKPFGITTIDQIYQLYATGNHSHRYWVTNIWPPSS